MAEGADDGAVWWLTFSQVQGRHDSTKWSELAALDRGPMPRMMHSLPLPVTIANPLLCSFAASLLHTSSTRILQARCRKSKRESPCARSAGTRARRTRRRPSARRDRLVRPCPLEWPLPRSQAPDALRPIPTGLGRDKMRHRPKCGRSGQIRRRTWSRGGTHRRSRRCPATSAMEDPCRKCHRCRRSIATRARRDSKDHLEAPTGAH
jgi:hypothetical protein